MPSEFGFTTRLIGIDANGFSEAIAVDINGEPVFAGGVLGAEPVFEIPFGAGIRFYNKDSVAHTVAAEDGSWSMTISAGGSSPANVTASSGTPALDLSEHTDRFARIRFRCPTHLDAESEPIKKGVLLIKPAGPADLNQSVSPNAHAGGCCRTSIKATLRHWYCGFSAFDGSVYPKFKTWTQTITFDTFNASPSDPLFRRTYWKSALVTGTQGGSTLIYRERFRHNRYIIRGRPEYDVTDGDNHNAALNASGSPGGRSEQWVEVDPDPEEETLYVKTYTAAIGAYVTVSPTRREAPIIWQYTDSRDGDSTVYDDGPAGTAVIELEDAYQFTDFIADCNALLPDWDDVEWPNCAMDSAWFTHGNSWFPSADVSSPVENGQRTVNQGGTCNLSEDTGSGFLPHADTSSLANWPPAPWPTQVPNGTQTTGQLPDYACIFSEPNGNALNQTASNLDAAADPPPTQSLSWPLWALGPAASPYRNTCASSQVNDDIISPPTHFMSGLTMEVDASNNFIKVTRTAVKRWWGAPYCRRVWEQTDSTPAVVHCEHSTGDFDGTDMVPSDATYDGDGEYLLTGLETGKTYKWTPGAGDASLEHDGTTYTAEAAFTVAAADVTLRGTVSGPVNATVKGNINYAPCAVLDDVAERFDMYPANEGLGTTWTRVNSWLATIQPGDSWSLWSEMDCPDYALETNPPCGCAP